MANLEVVEGSRSRRVRRLRSYSELDDRKPYTSRGKEKFTHEPDFSEGRTISVERLTDDSSTRRSVTIPTMTSASTATFSSPKSSSRHGREKEHRRSSVGSRQHRRVKSTSKNDSTASFVSEAPIERSRSSRIIVSGTGIREEDEEESSNSAEEGGHAMLRKPAEVEPHTRRVVYVSEDGVRVSNPRERRVGEIKERPKKKSSESVRRSRAKSPREKVEATSSPKRSATTRKARLGTTASHTSAVKTTYDPSLSANVRRSSFLGTFLRPSVPQQPPAPDRLVECLICLSDDIPRSKSAKLKCGHRICHSCLKRSFRLSVADPQHMPPKCCTSDHIPLKHVEKLFDINFKRTWNRKFQEFTTKNRIYCPARRCGEWIRPGNIHKENGQKYGKCGRCRTKVCCLCNGKWHGTKECPKDEETNRLLEAAKQAGWQRCYNCRTMVELKEGCNHMTCRCTAEFCMICGLKWKSCNCPWFNYSAVEADRLNHMQVPGEIPEQRPARLRRPRQANYQDEAEERRRQARADGELAYRLERAALEDGDDDNYQGGIGDIHGIGNGAGHFMNQDYVRAAQRVLATNFDQATAAANYVMGVRRARGVHPSPSGRMTDRYPIPPVARPATPPAVLRRHSMMDQVSDRRPLERRVEPEIPERRERAASTQEIPTPAVLAGLAGRRGDNRVHAWRSHVEPGITPEEGLLST